MAHVEKYHKGALGHLTKHYERAKDKDGNFIKFKNQNIDLTKTNGNYNLARFQVLSQIEFIQKRLGEVKVFNRSDVKVMCDWIVTLPKGMEKDERNFFEETFKFLTKKYGQENVISAYVHLDETQPHLHFAFIPVTVDKKKNIKKVSAKEVLTRNELQRFHTDLDNYLTSVFGRSTGVLNEATKEGNRSIDDLKRGTAIKEVREKREELHALEGQIKALKWADSIKPVKEKKDCVVISKADFEAAQTALVKKYLLESRTAEAERKATIAHNAMQSAVNRDYEIEIAELRSRITELQTERGEIVREYETLDIELERINKVFDENPELREWFVSIAAEMEQIQM